MNGNTVTLNYLFPDINTVVETIGTGVVGQGGTFPGLPGDTVATFVQIYPREIDLVNFSACHCVDLSFWPAAFNGYELINDSGSPSIIGVSVGFSYFVPGFDESRVTFDATRVWINMQGLTAAPGANAGLNLKFVPEPTTLPLLGSGLAALGLRRRRKTR